MTTKNSLRIRIIRLDRDPYLFCMDPDMRIASQPHVKYICFRFRLGLFLLDAGEVVYLWQGWQEPDSDLPSEGGGASTTTGSGK